MLFCASSKVFNTYLQWQIRFVRACARARPWKLYMKRLCTIRTDWANTIYTCWVGSRRCNGGVWIFLLKKRTERIAIVNLSLSPTLCYIVKSGIYVRLFCSEERYLIIIATTVFCSTKVILIFGYIVNIVEICCNDLREVSSWSFFKNSLVDCYSRRQNNEFTLGGEPADGQMVRIHFKSRGIEILPALIELPCKAEMNF